MELDLALPPALPLATWLGRGVEKIRGGQRKEEKRDMHVVFDMEKRIYIYRKLFREKI